MKRRILSLFLAAVMLVTCLPVEAFAGQLQAQGILSSGGEETVQEIGIREVIELQGAADLLPQPDIVTSYDADSRVLTVTKYPDGASLMAVGYLGGQMKFAMTDDQTAGKFILPKGSYDSVKVFALDSNYAPMCEAAEVNVNTLSVRFYDGKRLIDTLTTFAGKPLGKLPSADKANRDDAILLGYFLDEDGEEPFYAEDPVTENMDVYAIYEKLFLDGEPKVTAFAQMDQDPDISFKIQRISGKVSPKRAATLLIHDGSDPVELRITENADDTYTVSAKDGFNQGSSYQLELADGWVFVGKAESIRFASFSIAMEEVENLEMNSDIIYIKDTNSISYEVEVGTVAELNSENLTEVGGTFTYSGASVGDLLCIYVGTHPEERTTAAEMMKPVVYVKAAAVDGSTVTFRPLEESERGELYNIPDNFPILVSQLTNGGGTVNISALDLDVYAMLEDASDLKAYALENIAKGDFITMYVSQESVMEDPDNVRYGRITAYNAASGAITYESATMDDILHSMDLYMELPLSGEDLLSDEETIELESIVLQQVEESGFAEEAAWMLADIVTKTDGFREDVSVEEILLTDADGNPIDSDSIDLMGLGGKLELMDDVELTAEFIRSGDQLHFQDSGSVQLAVGVEAKFSVDLEDDAKVIIELGATFVEEVGIDPKVKAEKIKGKILFGAIPATVGVKVDASVDILNFTAFSFEAKIYTEEPEEKGTWEKLKNIADKPVDALGLDDLNPDLVKGLNNIGDVMGKIDTLKDKIKKAKEGKEKLEGYKKDIEDLYSLVSDEDARSWESFCETLGQTSITSDLLEMKNLTTETELETDYHESLEALMERYSEMIEQESGWVKLLEKKIFQFELNYFGLVLGVRADFVVRADLSMAVGSNLEYQVGKRYTFWFRIEKLDVSYGSGSMDIVDEEFGFQFYAMGRLGLKAGIRGKIYVALGTADFASIGVALELGPYVKIYGFFIYDYQKSREMGSATWNISTEMAGALHMEIGVYLLLEVEANAIGDLIEWSHAFLDKEIPLVQIGERYFYYDTVYKPAEDEEIRIVDTISNDKVISMKLPNNIRSMKYMDLTTGVLDTSIPNEYQIIWNATNRGFSYDPKTGIVTVSPKEGVRYIEGDLILTYKYNKMAFSNRDMSITVPLVWHNLSDEELATTCNATVRAGSPEFGYQTVWTAEKHIGEMFDLPSTAEVIDIMMQTDPNAYNRYRYYSYDYTYENADTNNGKNEVIEEDTVYTIHFEPARYKCTVYDIQDSAGNEYDRTYYAIFGEAFDFSDLESTGTTKPSDGASYTRFDYLKQYNPPFEPIEGDVTVDSDFAKAYGSKYWGLEMSAMYRENAVRATFNFSGIDREPVSQLIQRGTMADLSVVDELVCTDTDLSIVRVSPTMDEIYDDTQYTVYCAKLIGPKVTITFDGNGYAAASKTITRVAGSTFGLPVPQRPGYRFEGWFTAEGDRFIGNTTPGSDLTLKAEWTPVKYRVDFSNGADPIYVTYGEPYGPLPELDQSTYARGWTSDERGYNVITEDSVVNFVDKQTLYRQDASRSDINLTEKQMFGNPGAVRVEYDGQPHGFDIKKYFMSTNSLVKTYSISKNDFTVQYRVHGEEEIIDGEPVNAGTYDVIVTRKADIYRGKDAKGNTIPCYKEWKHEYNSYVVISKGSTIPGSNKFKLERVDGGLEWIKVKLDDAALEAIKAFAPNADIIYRYTTPGLDVIASESKTGDLTNIYGGYAHTYWNDTNKYFTVEVRPNDPNYAESIILSGSNIGGGLKSIELENWSSYADTDWYYNNSKKTTFILTTAEQLAGLARLVDSGTETFAGKTIKLGNDLDLDGRIWKGVGTSSTSLNRPFKGNFDGQGYTIRNMIVSGERNSGLFGYVHDGTIKNVTVKDSYILGAGGGAAGIAAYVRGIVLIQNCKLLNSKVIGAAYLTSSHCAPAGGIVGAVYDKSTTDIVIENCVNDSEIRQDHGRFYNNTQTPGAGGIVGTQRGAGKITVRNCVNYGDISSRTAMEIGGIVGHMENGSVVNTANFGDVNGNAMDHETRGVGGILGEALETSTNIQLYNNYNMGKVSAFYDATDYLDMRSQMGSVVSAADKITMKYNYYLKDTASFHNNFGTTYYGAAGSVDNDAAYTAASFTSPTAQLSETAVDMAGKTLIEALNAWVASENNIYEATQWVAGANGYPVPASVANVQFR